MTKELPKKNRWEKWEEELDRWETKFLKSGKFNVYRPGPTFLFIETKSHSWMLTRTVSGKTVAAYKDRGEFASPEELLKGIN